MVWFGVVVWSLGCVLGMGATPVFFVPLRPLARQAFKIPLVRAAGKGAILFGTGDALAQSLNPPPSEEAAAFDAQRVVSASAFGSIYVGCVVSSWYRYIDAAVPAAARTAGLAARAAPIFAKVAASWIVLGIGGNGCNILYRRLAKGDSVSNAVGYTKDQLPAVVAADAKVWPAFDVLLFCAIPPPLRPTSAMLASLAWNMYISLIAHQAH